MSDRNKWHFAQGILMLLVTLSIMIVPTFASSTTYLGNVQILYPQCNGYGTIRIFYHNEGQAAFISVSGGTYVDVRDVSSTIGTSYVDMRFYRDETASQGYGTLLRVKLGSGPSSASFDELAIFFDCRYTDILQPRVIAIDDIAYARTLDPKTINILWNDISTLPIRRNQINFFNRPAHGTVELGERGRAIYTPNSGYRGWDSFSYRICDISGMCDSADVSIYISARALANAAPSCDDAEASLQVLWPPNHQPVPITINGVTDPEGDAFTLEWTAVDVGEVNDVEGGDGNTDPDYGYGNTATGVEGWVRAERSGLGNGRTYVISFTARDAVHNNECSHDVVVFVPHDLGGSGDAEPVSPESSEAPTEEAPIVNEHANSNANSNAGTNNSHAPASSNAGGNSTTQSQDNGNGHDNENAKNDGKGRGANSVEAP